jgi:hypothetical protein
MDNQIIGISTVSVLFLIALVSCCYRKNIIERKTSLVERENDEEEWI